MADRAFRFGVVAAPQAGAAHWRDTARQAEQLGYDVLLTPDNLGLPAPTVSLGLAAGVTSTLRLGTYVMATPLRTPRAAAWDAHSLTQLTEGRFELGLGTGLPSMRAAAEELGLPYGDGARRLAQVSKTIGHLRTLEPDRHTKVLIAAGGPKARALAAAEADIVTLANGPLTPRSEMSELYAEVRHLAGDRDVELAMNLFVIGDEVPPMLRQFVPVEVATLAEHDSLTLLRGDTEQMVDELQRRRAELGVSYVGVNGLFLQRFAPVVERLAGR